MIDVVIMGAGGHGKDIRAIIEAHHDFNFAGYYDDRIGQSKVLGPISSYIPKPNTYHVIGVNSPSVRENIALRLKDYTAFIAPPIVHPSASVGVNVRLSEGVVIGAGAVLTTNIVVKQHTHINVNATISQGTYIGAFSTVSPGANICGSCHIGEKTWIGAGATIINLMEIGNKCTIGAGATVISNIPNNSTAVGTPARVIS